MDEKGIVETSLCDITFGEVLIHDFFKSKIWFHFIIHLEHRISCFITWDTLIFQHKKKPLLLPEKSIFVMWQFYTSWNMDIFCTPTDCAFWFYWIHLFMSFNLLSENSKFLYIRIYSLAIMSFTSARYSECDKLLRWRLWIVNIRYSKELLGRRALEYLFTSIRCVVRTTRRGLRFVLQYCFNGQN